MASRSHSGPPRIRTRSASGLVASAVAGLGIATVSTWMWELELASGELVEVLADYRLDPIDASILFPGGWRPPRKARAFADYRLEVLPGGPARET